MAARAAAAERFLVTGALGCIGAWVLRTLVEEGGEPVALDLGTDTRRVDLVLAPQQRERVTLVRGDVTDYAQLDAVAEQHEVTHLVHLAALLIPQIKADPPLGAAVNVVGATNVFELVKRRRLRGLAYASSAAVYGPEDAGAAEPEGEPRTLYGVFKRTNEATARVYWTDEGIGSVGLRPYVVYGPGRDTGLTADPTVAMEAAARGDGAHIAWGGRCQMQHAREAARVFVAAARAEYDGAAAFNIGGPTSHMRDVVAAIEAAAPDVAGRITFDDVQLPFPEALDAGGLEKVVGPVERIPLEQGVRETVAHFRGAA